MSTIKKLYWVNLDNGADDCPETYIAELTEEEAETLKKDYDKTYHIAGTRVYHIATITRTEIVDAAFIRRDQKLARTLC